MTVTIINHLGMALTGEIKCWMGRRVVEIEAADGSRHIGRIRPDNAATIADAQQVSTVDGVQ